MAPKRRRDAEVDVIHAAAGLGVVELATAYRDGTLTPVEAVEACLHAISVLDCEIGAWQAVYAEDARVAAQAATEAIAAGETKGRLLLGIPFALKDIIDVPGKVTTAGSVERIGHVASSAGEIVTRLLAQGGILLGKVTTVEFAMGAWGTNQRMGSPRNPWDAEVARACGGSSSGSSAAVAAAMVPCAVGTDTGGSVRLPAGLCGVVGLKTTKGLLPTDGIVPLSHTLDTVGPLARSVEDAAWMFAAMLRDGRGFGSADGHAHAMHGREFAIAYGHAKREGVSGLRLACMGARGRQACTDPAQLAAFDSAVEVLRGLGAEVTAFDWDIDALKGPTGAIMQPEGYYHHRALVDNPSSRMDDAVRARLLSGKSMSMCMCMCVYMWNVHALSGKSMSTER